MSSWLRYSNSYYTRLPFWEQILMTVPRRSNKRTNTWLNHPLVNAHKAYWQTDTTLCLGYRLTNDHAIFRPIFSHKRHLQVIEFQDNIKRVVELRKEKQASLAYIELFKIKKIPKVLVDKIIALVY